VWTWHAKKSIDGGTSCLLSILTFGLFLPVWSMIRSWESLRPWLCLVCRTKQRR
jgi:hypothetical protein